MRECVIPVRGEIKSSYMEVKKVTGETRYYETKGEETNEISFNQYLNAHGGIHPASSAGSSRLED